jgi:hypothetical protein
MWRWEAKQTTPPHQGCTNPGCQIAMAGIFCVMAPGVLRWLLDFCKIFASLLLIMCSLCPFTLMTQVNY